MDAEDFQDAMEEIIDKAQCNAGNQVGEEPDYDTSGKLFGVKVRVPED